MDLSVGVIPSQVLQYNDSTDHGFRFLYRQETAR